MRAERACLGVALAFAMAGAARAAPFLPFADTPLPGSTTDLPGDSSGGAGGVAGPSGGPFALPPAAVPGNAPIGAIDFPYGLLPPPPGESNRGWSVVPSIGAQVLYTDNLDQTRTNKRSDLITSILPAILLSVDTTRLRGIVNVAPSIQFHSASDEPNRVDNRFNGQLLATVVPDQVFIDLRGAAGTQSLRGGFAPQGNAVVGTNDRVQTTSFQISPYLVHRFGGLGTVRIGYAFQYSSQELGSGNFGGGNGGFGPGGPRFFNDQNFTAHEFFAVGRTGEDFGRVALESRLSSISYDGTGVLDGAYRRLAALEARYAFSRAVIGLVEGGFEQQRYSGTPGYEISEPLWSVGARLNLSPESWITARYGHRDGFNSFSLDAVAQLGVRTQLFANYGERLSTSSQNAVDLLSTTTLDERGNPVDTLTGAPTSPSYSNSLLGVQSGLFRVRRGTVSVSQTWPRDRVTLSVSHEEREPISAQFGTVATSQSGTYGTVSWSHELTPITSAVANVQYGRFTSPSYGGGDVITAGLSLITQLRPGLSGYGSYTLTSRTDDTASGRALQNVVLIGLRQSF